MRRWGILSAITALAALGASANGAYVPEQAADGRSAYLEHCASCHGEGLGGRFGPPLTGTDFVTRWGAQPVDALSDYLHKTMPPATPDSLSPATYATLARFLRSANGMTEAPPASASADPRGAPQPKAVGSGLSVSPMADDPFAQAHAARMRSLVEGLTPVTDDMLSRPAAGDWPTWRRTRSLDGFTPLDRIDKTNVAGLGVAWALSLKPGTNGIEPLVQDGILFINASGVTQALDGTSGNIIWEYSRVAAKAATPLSQPRSMTLYEGKLFVPTLDAHMIALDARSGKLVWDHALEASGGNPFILTGAPLAVRGKIIQGVSGCIGGGHPGGCFIVALDARDGREIWRFNTIARPDEPGGNSWNGASLDKRFGGSVWTGGSYDPDLNLAYFGVGQTYKIATLLDPNPAATGASRDALYTDSTLALNPDSGALVWHYQHVAGDVWDFDWAFERTLTTLPGPKGPRKVIVTAGKLGIVDVLDAGTGRYLWSADLGVQSLVTAIDPRTGHKTLDPKLLPVRSEMRTVCPSAFGGRNWPATSVDSRSHLIFFPMLEACMEIGLGDTMLGDFRLVTRTRPSSDGKLGRVLALDLDRRKIVWVDRMRAPAASAVLVTSTGIVFEGDRDRWFRARDDATGKVLWQIRLDDMPNGFPISYAAGGRQYVAIVTGGNTPYDLGIRGLTPEIRNATGSRTLWTFSLPEPQRPAH